MNTLRPALMGEIRTDSQEIMNFLDRIPALYIEPGLYTIMCDFRNEYDKWSREVHPSPEGYGRLRVIHQALMKRYNSNIILEV